MIYFADLHVHSKYSRATSQSCDLLELARWACLKGIRVVATGDFTHPAWREEITASLEEAEPGLYRLRQEVVPPLDPVPDGFGPADVRFVLNVEISSIYKKAGATRKVHNLVFMPDFESMEEFSRRLGRIGNLASDGRPILGLDSRDLLEIALETTDDAMVIPAHVWTPWFSILGSKSGFDGVEECFGDLSSHIFALETGLSSDPEMNHRVSALDRFTLVSNSDTHSPPKLGREVNIFSGRLGYHEMRDALRTGGSSMKRLFSERPLYEAIRELQSGHPGTGETHDARPATDFVGTIEFFPEEGKYHVDGHRKCGVRLEPEETERLRGRCPVCGHPVTVGVMHRVLELADRPPGYVPDRAAPYWRLLPLQEVVAQALDVGPTSKAVDAAYRELLRLNGPELTVLWVLPLDEIQKNAPEIIVEAIRRVRAAEVEIDAGFDGQYGTVRLFGPGERDRFSRQMTFIAGPRGVAKRRPRARAARASRPTKASAESTGLENRSTQLNEEQRDAVATRDRPVLVQAGPGTGKTGTLAHRIASLLQQGAEGAPPKAITAVTFTRKAAAEMRERVERLVPDRGGSACWFGTFHQLGQRILEFFAKAGAYELRETVLGEEEALRALREAIAAAGLKAAPASVPAWRDRISFLKQNVTVHWDSHNRLESRWGRYGGGDGLPLHPHRAQSRLKPGEPLEQNLADCADHQLEPDLKTAYAAYEQFLDQHHAMDLDDLIVHPVRLLRQDPDQARAFSRACAEELLVDEFQDVNRAQYEMVRLLVPADGRGLFVIGDPDQAIYGFRGADRRFFLRFHEDYPSAHVVRLVRNYRSLAGILRAGRAVLDGTGPGEALISDRSGEGALTVADLPNAATEAEFIVRAIDGMLGGASFFSIDSRNTGIATEGGVSFRDIAVLYRLNAVGDALEEAFASSGIPYQRAKRVSPTEEAEAHDPRGEAVTLMTVHASKGLEFPIVFVAGCEECIMPYVPPGRSSISADELEEERRLLYVAMTRAADRLFLTHAGHRMIHGRTLEGKPSRFLDALDDSMCQRIEPLKGRRRSRSRGPKQCELFGEE